MVNVKRDARSVSVAIGLLIIGLIALAGAVGWIYHRHRADEAALHRDPSYRYGLRVSPYSVSGDTLRAVRRSCAEIVSHRHPFEGFAVDRAADGCVDGWVAVM